MTRISSTNSYTYLWSVSPTTNSGIYTATVSGSDSSGNYNSGTERLTFRVDTSSPTVILTHDSNKSSLKPGDNVLISALFSESLSSTPTISVSGVATNVSMQKSSTINFGDYWRRNTSSGNVEEPNNSCNSNGCENFSYLSFVSTPSSHVQYNKMGFVDYGSGGDSLNWIVEVKTSQTSLTGYTHVGGQNGSNYFLSLIHI